MDDRGRRRRVLFPACSDPFVMVLALTVLLAGASGSFGAGDSGSEVSIHLTGEPAPVARHYRLTTEVIPIEPQGQRGASDVYDLWLEYVPRPGSAGDLVTCRRFTVSQGSKGDRPAVALPSLEGWSYSVPTGPTSLDERGFLFGIDQAKFEGLRDASGATLPLPVAYAVYNAFVDFHMFEHAFARRTSEGKGIQDLRAVGQKLLHASAHSEPPVSLGRLVEKGSYFRNGAVTLELKGLTRVGGRRCALVGYDSGDSSFKMMLKPLPQVAVEVNGGSHYMGDLYVDLERQWLLKGTLTEIVVSETSGAALPDKVRSVIERRLLLRALRQGELERIARLDQSPW